MAVKEIQLMRKILGAACATLFFLGAVSAASAAGCNYDKYEQQQSTKDQRTS